MAVSLVRPEAIGEHRQWIWFIREQTEARNWLGSQTGQTTKATRNRPKHHLFSYFSNFCFHAAYFSCRCFGPLLAAAISFNQDSPDEARTGVYVCAFAAL